jgi:chromosome segregation ATPase
MANEVLIATFEKLLRANLEKQNKAEKIIQDLDKQIDRQRGDLQQAQQAKQNAESEVARVKEEYKTLLAYSNNHGQPQELREEVQRLQHQQSEEFEKSKPFSRGVREAENSLQQTERSRAEQKEILKALVEEKQKLDLHISNAK